MKKVVILISVFTVGYAVLGGFGSLQELRAIDTVSNGQDTESATYVAKYRDCIALGDFPGDMAWDRSQLDHVPSKEIVRLSTAIADYGRHLSTNLRNMSYIDAHNHIHQEFQRTRASLLQDGLGDSQKYYFLEIMQLCYENDKALNLGTARHL